MEYADVYISGKTPVIPAVITGDQIRAARSLLKWTSHDLSTRCGVSHQAINKIENSVGTPNTLVKTMQAIQGALESGGVIFLEAGENRDGGPGVRLRKAVK